MTRDYRWLLIGAEHARDSVRDMPPPAIAPSDTLAVDGDEVRLFVRGDESIRLLIRQATKTLLVFGPGRAQKVHDFTTVADLQQFLASYEQDVLDGGWGLLDITDRRLSGRS